MQQGANFAFKAFEEGNTEEAHFSLLDPPGRSMAAPKRIITLSCWKYTTKNHHQ